MDSRRKKFFIFFLADIQMTAIVQIPPRKKVIPKKHSETFYLSKDYHKWNLYKHARVVFLM